MGLKTGLVGALVGLLGASCMATTPANATIWADLDSKEVSGKNDGIDNVWVTKDGRTQRLRNPNAAMPLKGKPKSAPMETARMTIEGEIYYSKIFNNDVAKERAWALSDEDLGEAAKAWASSTAERNIGNCPLGKKYYERRSGVSFFGIKLGKGSKTWSGCLTDGEAAAAGAGTTTYSPSYAPPVQTYQPTPQYCYGSSFGGTFSASCY